jgi:hypothetical protein
MAEDLLTNNNIFDSVSHSQSKFNEAFSIENSFAGFDWNFSQMGLSANHGASEANSKQSNNSSFNGNIFNDSHEKIGTKHLGNNSTPGSASKIVGGNNPDGKNDCSPGNVNINIMAEE